MIRKGVRLLCQLEMGLADIGEVNSCGELVMKLSTGDYTPFVLDLSLSDGSSIDNIYHDLLRKVRHRLFYQQGLRCRRYDPTAWQVLSQ